MVDGKSKLLQAQASASSQLGQWPCQMKLVPVNAPYFGGSKLLIAADCTAFTMPTCIKSLCMEKLPLLAVPSWTV